MIDGYYITQPDGKHFTLLVDSESEALKRYPEATIKPRHICPECMDNVDESELGRFSGLCEECELEREYESI